MTTPAVTLPAPPDGERLWSIMTLAAYLCIPAWRVEQNLTPIPQGSQGDSPDILTPRYGHYYEIATDRHNEDRGDCYLDTQAAERIARELPTGPLARGILDSEFVAQIARLDLDQVQALAAHIVEHLGGDAR